MSQKDRTASVSVSSELLQDILCQPCKEDGKSLQAEGFCKDCAEYLCSTCYTHHCRPKPMRNHVLVPKDEMPIDVLEIICPNHAEQIGRYFCNTHNQVCCQVCEKKHHKTCTNVVLMSDVSTAPATTEEYGGLMNKLQFLARQPDEIKKMSNDKAEHIRMYHAQALNKIRSYRKEINNYFDRLEKDIEKEVEKMKEVDTEAITNTTRACDLLKKKIEEIIGKLKVLQIRHEHCQLFMTMRTLKDKIINYEDVLHQLEIKDINRYVFDPNMKVLKMLTSFKVLGQLVKSIKWQATDDIHVRLEADKHVSNITGVASLTKDQIVIADAGNSRIKLIEIQTGITVAHLKTNFKPWDVISLDKSNVAVTFPRESKIKFLSVFGELTINREIEVDGSCKGIAHYRGSLIVTFTGPVKVDIMDLNGKVLRRFCEEIQKKKLFSWPLYVAISSDGDTLYVSDFIENSVTSLSVKGKAIAVYSDLQNPVGLAVDRDGSVLVCCQKSNNVHQFTPGSSERKRLLTKKDGLSQPRSIHYSNYGDKMYLGMLDSDNVKLFTSTYQPPT